MFKFYQLFLQNLEIIGVCTLSIVLGAAIATIWLNNRHRQRLWQQVSQLQTVREELASTRGQLSQLQQNANEKTALLKEARLQLGNEFESLANRIFDNKQQQFDQQNSKTLSHSLSPLKIQINEFKEQVAKVYEKENAERNKLIGKINELQQQTQRIGEDAVNLALALKGDNKFQGNWGEVILERLLEEAGLQKGREYDTQVRLNDEEGNRRNPDVVIYLPEDKQLIIDSKVSLAHYEHYINMDNDNEKAQALKSHINSIRQHIKRLSRKNYENLTGIQTLDFVFIFMPVEAAFMLALQHEPELFREAYNKQIVLVSPTTLMATLRTVSNLWRYHKQHKNVEQIAAQAGGLYDQFALVISSLDDLGGILDKAKNSYQQTCKRLYSGKGNLVGRIEKLKTLGAKTKKQLPVDRIEDYSQDKLEQSNI
ncbi:hypothetical protein AB835_04885 [Candidatus Endobugula sertula]|uniref:Recombinase RmuC n=1 Tax=Candidatus Endobugula sertula TaxID=62101 RepID=A0A1D2QRJ6_9GAMM|nr:hypothetical protein AB835_04885 [Candidatus Endobugula sertula]